MVVSCLCQSCFVLKASVQKVHWYRRFVVSLSRAVFTFWRVCLRLLRSREADAIDEVSESTDPTEESDGAP
jgi:hypothetical protein